MPTFVPTISWRCKQCNKERWLKPGLAKVKLFCSRACLYESRRVPGPVRSKQSAKKTFGPRSCGQCGELYEARAKQQMYCSQDCGMLAMQERRRGLTADPRPCEYCGATFTPRLGSAGRFCSFDCKNQGQSGAAAAHWKGGRHVSPEGYVKVLAPSHPKASGHGGYVLEHRLVMEQSLGRLLEDHETVHHINGARADNRPENLQLRSGRHGKGARAEKALEDIEE